MCFQFLNKRLSAESAIASRRWKFLEKITVSKISYLAYLLLMTQKNFLIVAVQLS